MKSLYDKEYFQKRYRRYRDKRFMEFCSRLSGIKFWRFLNKESMTATSGKTNRSRQRKVLVVGCGLGVDMFGRKDVTGIDISGYAVDFCRKRGMDARVMDALNLKFRAGSFDGVISSHNLEHLGEPLKALREMHRVLKPGGKLALALPTHDSYQGTREDGHFYCWTPVTISNLLEQAGFQVLAHRRFNFRLKFIVCRLPFSLGRFLSSLAGIFLRDSKEFVVYARKSKRFS